MNGARILDTSAEAMDAATRVVESSRHVTKAVQKLSRGSTPEQVRSAVSDARAAVGMTLVACARISEQLGALDEQAGGDEQE